MKRWNLKSFVAGIAVTAIVSGLGIPALAVAQTKAVDLYYNNITIRLNGKELKDASGYTVEPFVIDGTTYLPVRAVAEGLGLNVGWDGTTKTVILGNDTQMGQPAAWLGELEPFTGSADEDIVTDQQYNSDSTANNGDTFNRYYSVTQDDGVSYLLKDKYSRFTGTWYLSAYLKNTDYEARFLVYADDTLVYTSPAVTAGVEPVSFNVDVKNCYELKIVQQVVNFNYDNTNTWFNSVNDAHFLYAYIGNAALWTD